MRYVYVISILIAAFCSKPSLAEPKADLRNSDRPNILFIIADDLGARLGCYGDPVALTPELDALAKQGVLFRNCFTQFATCGPSRASMLSGLYPFQTGITRNGIKLDQSETPFTSLPKLFSESGYYTARVGKVFHMGIPGGIGQAGADDAEAWDIAINNTGWDGNSENYNTAKKHGGTDHNLGTAISYLAPDIPNERMADGVGTQEALRLMSERHPEKTGKPLMLFMGYYRPHPPMIAPLSHWKKVAKDKIQLPVVPDNDRRDIPDANFHLLDDSFNFIPDSVGRSYTEAYYAAINFIDTEVGKLLAGLKANGLDKNTIVIFTGDQGFHLGEHGHWHKSTFFEEASRVPLIIADLRSQSPSGEASGLCGLIDLYPTLCELSSIDPAHPLSGKSLNAMLKDPSALVHSQVLTEGNPEGASVRTDRYRYTEWEGGRKGAMLYDLQNDPREYNNLIGNREYSQVEENLKKELRNLLGE